MDPCVNIIFEWNGMERLAERLTHKMRKKCKWSIKIETKSVAQCMAHTSRLQYILIGRRGTQRLMHRRRHSQQMNHIRIFFKHAVHSLFSTSTENVTIGKKFPVRKYFHSDCVSIAWQVSLSCSYCFIDWSRLCSASIFLSLPLILPSLSFFCFRCHCDVKRFTQDISCCG